MDYFKERQFFFESQAPGLDSHSFSVVRFTGDEGLSSLYEFEITVVPKYPDLIDVDKILKNPATLYLKPNQ